MVILKIALIAIGGAILALVVRQFQKEYSVFVLLAVCLFLIAYLTSNVSVIVEFAENLGEKIQISDAYIKILFKLMGIALHLSDRIEYLSGSGIPVHCISGGGDRKNLYFHPEYPDHQFPAGRTIESVI